MEKKAWSWVIHYGRPRSGHLKKTAQIPNNLFLDWACTRVGVLDIQLAQKVGDLRHLK